MFVIAESPTVGPTGDTLCVLDQQRGVWLQRIGSYAMSPAKSFQLRVRDRVFLLEQVREQQSDGRYASKIVNLAFSPIGAMISGIESDTLRSKEERQEVGLLAAEALLVFGGYYDGSSDPTTNTQSVEFDGRTYNLSDLVASSS